MLFMGYGSTPSLRFRAAGKLPRSGKSGVDRPSNENLAPSNIKGDSCCNRSAVSWTPLDYNIKCRTMD